MDVAEYLDRYEIAWGKLQQSSPGLMSYEDRMLYSTWQVSFDHVHKINVLSANLLRLWAYFDNQDVWYELLCHNEEKMRRRGDQDETYQRPEWIVEIVKDKLTFEAAVRVLHDHGLVQPHSSAFELTESAGYSIHSCVHSWTRTVLNPVGMTDLAVFALKCVASHVPIYEFCKYWLTERRLLRHVLYAAKSSLHKCPVGLAWVYLEFGTLCRSTRKDTEAVLLLEEAWHEVDETATDLHFKSSVALSLGDVYRMQADLSKANDMAQVSLQGLETIHGPQHHLTLDAMSLLADVYEGRAQWAKAKDLYVRVLQVQEAILGSKDQSILFTVAKCSRAHEHLGQLEEAESFLQRALRGLHETYGLDHRSFPETKLEVARLLVDKGQYEVPEEMLLQVLVAWESIYGSDSLEVFLVNLDLGIIHTAQRRWTESEVRLFRALEGYEKLYGLNAIVTLRPIRGLGRLYKAQSRFADAENMYLQAVRGLGCTLGPSHMDTAVVMNDFGDLYYEQKRFKEAEDMYLKALQSYEVAFGPDHIDTLQYAVLNLANAYNEQDKLKEAEEMYIRALKGLEPELGQSHYSARRARNKLGRVYRKLDRFEQAEEMYSQALSGYEAAYGPCHVKTLRVPVYNLVLFYIDQGRLERAEEMYQRVLQGRDEMSAKKQEAVDWLGKKIERLRQQTAENSFA